ncbi:MAG: hypothetical protein ABH835_04650 [Patescibacteria group bacterium]
MPEPTPKFLQDLPEVENLSPNDKVKKAELKIDGAETIREIGDKYDCLIIFEGMAGYNDPHVIETISNFELALEEIKNNAGENPFKEEKFYLASGQENPLPEKGKVTPHDRIEIQWGMSKDDIIDLILNKLQIVGYPTQEVPKYQEEDTIQ